MAFSTDIIHMGLEPVSREKAFVIICLKFGLGQFLFMQVLSVTIVRYLIIFHGPIINSINDRSCDSLYKF